MQALSRGSLGVRMNISQLQRSLDQASSAPSNSSWQAVNSPDDGEKKRLRDAVDQLQSVCAALEGQNKLLSDKLGDQESFVEQSHSAPLQKDEETKDQGRGYRRVSVVAPQKGFHGVILIKSY